MIGAEIACDPGGRSGHRGTVAALLSFLMEQQLVGAPPAGVPSHHALRSPWDVWWICYRASTPARDLGLHALDAAGGCDGCRADVAALTATATVGHPGAVEDRDCGCLRDWAISMRSPEAPLVWPALHLSVAMIKPGASITETLAALSGHFSIEYRLRLSLKAGDVRRLYPEAYGAEFIDAQDAYLTSSPVTVLVLRAEPPRQVGTDLKRQIRRELGDTGPLRNHLHMPDNPGETWCDLIHLVGRDLLMNLYGRYDRPDAAERLDHYRALLGCRPAGPLAG